MSHDVFDDFADVYEAMVNWPKRLAHETPFYRHWFNEAGVRRVVDVACGSGRHAEMFHQWGLAVEGADVSPAMLAQARRRCGEPAGLRWIERSFDTPADGDAFDAAICVGNSLATAPDLAAAHRAIAAMLDSVRPGGLVVVHVLNFAALPQGPCLWQKCQRIVAGGREQTLLKGVHRTAEQGFVEVVLIPTGDPAAMQSRSTAMLLLDADELEIAARRAGAETTIFFGGYGDQPFDPATSTDLILVARK